MQKVIKEKCLTEYLQRHADLVLSDKLVGQVYMFKMDAAIFWNTSKWIHELYIFFDADDDDHDLFDILK
jgi:hypothetical protein